MSQAELLDVLSQQARKHLDPTSPMPMRMMAAKGMAPLPPFEMVVVMSGLALDADEKIAASAVEGLAKLPEKILGPALDADLPKVVYEVIAPHLVGRPDMLQKLVLARTAPDGAIAAIAAAAPAAVVEIIAGNQERCLRSEAVVRGVAKNPHILRSSLDRLFDFLVRSGVIYEGMSQFAEAVNRLSPAEMHEAVANIVLPPEAEILLHRDEESAAEPSTEPMPEERRLSLLQLVYTLNPAQKIALAMRGNREARTLLIRDNNRMVATSVVRSGRMTEQEVLMAAQNRSVSDEVLRIVANSKDMTRPYGVKVALVNNPKTPQPTAMRFLTVLRQADIKLIAKSKNVPSAVANQAKRMMLKKGT
ncbi:MAG: hypothetical protein A2341_02435 [Deltaproteobacteria bacterium RIFOXYB12_FULL_58_9]|nr:MAG: hypothetical protein A2341_02435 [Deltaproteobacteria bacterium RIFOXYB12_FULL_58_9]